MLADERTIADVSSNPEMLSQPHPEGNWSQYEELPSDSPDAPHSSPERSLEEHPAEEDALLPTAAGRCVGGGPVEEPAEAGMVPFLCAFTHPGGTPKQGYSHSNFKPALLSDRRDCIACHK